MASPAIIVNFVDYHAAIEGGGGVARFPCPLSPPCARPYYLFRFWRLCVELKSSMIFSLGTCNGARAETLQ